MSLPQVLTDKTRNVEFSPKLVVDVGANRGSWGRTVLGYYPSCRLFMIEASEKHQKRLEQLKKEKINNNQVDYVIQVLGETSGMELDFFGNGDTGNSIFREQSKHYQDAIPTKRITQSLDDLVATHSFFSSTSVAVVDLLKLDVQGAELMVLRGASQVLETATFVQLETSVVDFNAGGACPWEIDAHLRHHGYRVLDIWDLNYMPDLFQTPGVGQYDVLYLNTKVARPRGLERVQFCQGGERSTTTSDGSTGVVSRQSMLQDTTTTARYSSRNLLECMTYIALGYLLCYLQGRLRLRRGRTE